MFQYREMKQPNAWRRTISTYELIWQNTGSAILALRGLDLVIYSPCPGWCPCSSTWFRCAFEWAKPSFTPFLKSWRHPVVTSIAFLFHIDLRSIDNPFPFSATTIKNCAPHYFSIIICQRNFSFGIFTGHLKLIIFFISFIDCVSLELCCSDLFYKPFRISASKFEVRTSNPLVLMKVCN